VELVQIEVRGPGGRVSVRPMQADELLLCSRGGCPWWGGQQGLFERERDFVCMLVGYRPDRTCHPFYLETAETLGDRALGAQLAVDGESAREDLWRRLEDAELHEQRLARLAAEAGL
jgi:hypothetical protein